MLGCCRIVLGSIHFAQGPITSSSSQRCVGHVIRSRCHWRPNHLSGPCCAARRVFHHRGTSIREATTRCIRRPPRLPFLQPSASPSPYTVWCLVSPPLLLVCASVLSLALQPPPLDYLCRRVRLLAIPLPIRRTIPLQRVHTPPPLCSKRPWIHITRPTNLQSPHSLNSCSPAQHHSKMQSCLRPQSHRTPLGHSQQQLATRTGQAQQ